MTQSITRQAVVLAAPERPPHSWYARCVAILSEPHFALVLLDRWPFFVAAILGADAGGRVVVGRFDAIRFALLAAVLGASLAPVVAHDLPSRAFPRS